MNPQSNTFRGQMHDGVIVPAEGAVIPENAEVIIHVIKPEPEAQSKEERMRKFEKFIDYIRKRGPLTQPGQVIDCSRESIYESGQ